MFFIETFPCSGPSISSGVSHIGRPFVSGSNKTNTAEINANTPQKPIGNCQDTSPCNLKYLIKLIRDSSNFFFEKLKL